jgi:PKD repeat protein
MRLTGGAGSALTMPTLNLDTNTVTITGWINPSGYQSGWAGVVFCRGGTTVSGVNFGPGSPANELRYTWNNDRFDASTGLIVPTNQWSFFALVVTPIGATVYLGTNGVLNSFTDSAALSSSAFDAPLLLGEDPSSGGRYYAGALDEIAVFNQSLSPAQIQMLYSNALVALSPSTASFTGNPASGTAPLAVTFTDGSTGSITNWYWNFGDGNTTNFSIQTNPVHTYVAGTYSVTLTVSGPGGTNSLTRSSYIAATNPAPPVAAFIGSPTTGAAPLMVRFTDNSSGSISNWFWNFGDGNTTNFATLTNPTHTYAVGTYSVSLTASGLGGTNTSTQSNYIQALHPAQLLVNPSSLNYGSVTIGLTNLLNFSVINTGGAALSGTAASPAPFVVTSGGSYNVAGAQTATVTVAFAPSGSASFNGSVIFTSNGGDSTNAVSGVGLTPGSIAVSPATLDFGALATGTTAQASFVVTNSGETVVSNGTAAISGGPFSLLSGAAFSVPGLGSTNVVVQFAPVSAGGFTDSVVFATDNGGNASNTVTGTGAVAPVAGFTVAPVAGTELLGVTLSDASTGTRPITLVWNLGDSVLVTNSGGARFNHTYAAGVYTVVLTASNAFGTSSLVSNNVISAVTALQAWQQSYFGCTNCAQAQPDADPYGKGISNTNQFLLGLNPTNPASLFQIISAAPQDSDVLITWTAGGGRTNVVQMSQGDASGGYSNSFSDISGPIFLTGSGDVSTNYLDSGGATNSPFRYYRIRLVP